jgi:3-oxoadipate enol-lactonase
MSAYLVATEVGDLAFEQAGTPSGPPVLLWPSLWSTRQVFNAQVAALGDTYRLVLLDPPGHGDSGRPPERFSLEELARATFQVIDHLGIDRTAIVGGAWGGMVGVQMASMKPERISSLVTINSPLDAWHGFQRLQMWSLLPLIKIGGPSAAAPFLIGGMLSRTTRKTRPDLVASIRADIRACDKTNLFRAARAAMIDRPSLLPVLPGLSLPVLVITGSKDFVPVERARAEAALIRGSRFEVIDDVAHLSAYEAPERVNALLLPFLAENA